jgi:Protein of unknown function (DUF2924)
MKKVRYDQGWLAKGLAILPSLSRDELLLRWNKYYDREPPFKISNELLVMSVAYRMQELTYGGLNPAKRRYLLNIAADLRAGKQVTEQPRLKPGTRLLREWKGITHEVTILEEGVLYKKQQYRSLSEVAKHITEAHWSGPLFFGMKSAKRKRHDSA